MSAARAGFMVRVSSGRVSSLVMRRLSRAGTGTVHSVFHSSLNLEFGGSLIHMDAGGCGLCCFGIAIGQDALSRILTGCGAGSLVSARGGKLCIYGTGTVAILELSRFEEVSLKIPVFPAGTELSGFFHLMERQAESLMLGILRDESFLDCSRILSSQAASSCGPELSRAVRFFLGRGQGLTPAGDDILTGYGAMLFAFGKEGAFLETLAGCGRSTTDVSLAYLDAMAEGYANEIFIRLLLLARGGDGQRLRALLVRFGNIGHTSGNDTLYGVYLGMKQIML